MRGRILPLDDIAEYGKTDAVAVMLTLDAAEATQIMGELVGTERAQELSHNALKLYELLEIVAHRDGHTRRVGRDVINTEGRYYLGVKKEDGS